MDTAKLLSAAGALCFAIGLLYDFGYFAGIDLNFFMMLSYKDHLAATAFFGPPALLLAACWMGWRAKARDSIAFVWIGLVFFMWTSGDEYAAIPRVAFAAVWFCNISSFVLTGYLVAKLFELFTDGKLDFLWGGVAPGNPRAFVGASLGLVGMVTLHGYETGRIELPANRFDYEITLDEKVAEGGSAKRMAHLVRTVDDELFVVTKDMPERLTFMRKDTVRMISRPIGN